ncbi:methyl-accepting chemotaxis protein [Sphingobium phenoxybenzoativorans]|uniref:Methyl-accepting chemotaxis protein n=1 Tax=Sphingobium phenoxybenzoativorans TaxID=1592790 RepID=A0A975Q3D1_9SPHN|nr:methyl-accepting chemotaxis protein [Sphingobium phenoxybenzoativorans]QUT07764.1 methyl-accepting chemotaxis protein [Sphingobium phenoxybenzoativorans]
MGHSLGAHLEKQELLAELGEQSAEISLQCSEAAGFLAQIDQRIQSDAAHLARLQSKMEALSANQAESGVAALELRVTAQKAERIIAEGNDAAALSLDEVAGLIAHVTGLEVHLRNFLAVIEAVGGISDELGAIAHQTRMLGVNAAIEAARGGEATQGFAVVADEIRRLAAQAGESARSVREKLDQLDSNARGLMSGVEANIVRGREAGIHIDDMRTMMTEVSSLVTQFQQRSHAIAGCTEEAGEDVESLRAGLDEFSRSACESAVQVNHALGRLDELESTANTMLNRVAHGGVRTRNSKYIAMAEEGAEEVAALIGDALDSGHLTAEALFDTRYRKVPGSDPIQYLTDFVDFADLRLRALLDRRTALDPAVVGCCLVDMNGFLPTHISARSQPQRQGDRLWNLENARNRQIFMDGQTRRALDSDGDFFLFTYRQDLGEGRYRALRSVFVPLEFGGRRWGLYEVGYLI